MIALRSPEQIAEEAILPGETLKWSGVPPRGFYWRSSDWCTVPLASVWCVLVGVGFANALLSGRMGLQTLVPLVFFAVGLYASVGRFFWDADVRSRTVYAVSDCAAYIIVSGLLGHRRRLSGAQLKNVKVRHGSNGAGTITFPSADPWWLHDRGYTAPAFEGTSDVQGAYAGVLAVRW